MESMEVEHGAAPARRPPPLTQQDPRRSGESSKSAAPSTGPAGAAPLPPPLLRPQTRTFGADAPSEAPRPSGGDDTSVAASSDDSRGIGLGPGRRPSVFGRRSSLSAASMVRKLSVVPENFRRASELSGQVLKTGLGLRAGKAGWGLENLDLGYYAQKTDWYTQAQVHDTTKLPTWWNTPWRRVPEVRHLWGEPQYQLHPGPQELFLDLIFVGVAYRIGSVMKLAFYACQPPEELIADPAARRLVGSFDRSWDLECIGLWLGILHSLAPFMCMYLLWQIETSYRARFFAWSKVHAVCDVVTSFLLLLTGMNIGTVQAYRGHPEDVGLTVVLAPILIALLIWLCRTAELALLSSRECARRQCAAELVVGSQIFLMWTTAMILSMMDFGSWAANATVSDICATLMWLGNLWWLIRSAQRPLMKLWVKGPHLPLEQSAVCNNFGFLTHRNNEFMFLMLGETVLQLVVVEEGGAAALEGASDKPSAANNSSNLGGKYSARVGMLLNTTSATAAASFLLALCLMFSFRQMVVKQLASYSKANNGVAEVVNKNREITDTVKARLTKARASSDRGTSDRTTAEEPSSGHAVGHTESAERAASYPIEPRRSSLKELLKHSKTIANVVNYSEQLEVRAQRLLLKARALNVVSSFMWQTKACAVMLVGVGVKLAIFNPSASSDAHFALEQRLELGIPVMLAFATQLFNTVYLRNRHHYTMEVAREHPRHIAVVCTRFTLLVTTVGICFVPMTPLVLLIIQAILACLQCALLHAQEHMYPISSSNQAYDHEMPACLNALRMKAQRHRMNGVPRGLRGGENSLSSKDAKRMGKAAKGMARRRLGSIKHMRAFVLPPKQRRTSAMRFVQASKQRTMSALGVDSKLGAAQTSLAQFQAGMGVLDPSARLRKAAPQQRSRDGRPSSERLDA